jgi:lysozyme
LTFVICKGTEGITYTDPKFAENWAGISKKGFIRGSYHFYRTNDDPIKQVQNFTNVVKFEDTDIPPIVDFEEGSIVKGNTIEEIQADLIIFLKELEALTGRKPMIYTDINTGNKYLDKPEFTDYPLWIANYTKADKPNLPKNWEAKGWTFWQKNDTQKIDSTVDDYDVFNGNKTDLVAFIKNSKL